ncbi:MAG TPA: hypothetical protein VIG51_10725 [Candidatus Baltobacteraceae bacterium]
MRVDNVREFLREHSLSIVVLGIFSLWLILYCFSDPSKHLGAFFGNAIADWSGSVVIILATKYFRERGSKESRPCKDERRGIRRLLYEHSLTIFLVLTGIGWAALFAHSQTNSKWGQVAGNVLSEWVQMIGLVYLTKGLIERGSPESK